MIKLYFILVFFFFNVVLHAQHSVKILVQDSASGEKVAFVSIVANEDISATSNSYGYANLQLNQGINTIQFFHISYKKKEIDLFVSKDTFISIKLSPIAYKLRTTTVTKRRSIKQEFGKINIPQSTIMNLPVVMTEPDPLRAIQNFPGIVNSSENNTGLYIRGGNIDQTMMLLDEAPVYNSFHLFGFISTFDANAVKEITLYKSGIPAKYGGRGASVVDIKMTEGNMKTHKKKIDIGIIGSKMAAEGPLIKDKLSYFVSGRTTYLDKIAFEQGVSNRFYDVNAKFNYNLNKTNSFYLSYFRSSDKFDFEGDIGYGINLGNRLKWENNTITGRWNHVFKKGLFVNNTLSYGSFNHNHFSEYTGNELEVVNQINNLVFKSDFELQKSDKTKIDFGYQFSNYKNLPSDIRSNYDTFYSDFSIPLNRGIEHALYVDVKHQFNKRLFVNLGLRNGFYMARKPNKTNFYIPEPRLKISYKKNANTKFFLAYDKATQYQHLVSATLIVSPADFYISSNDLLPPQKSHTITLGAAKELEDWTIGVESYYRKFINTFDYKDGAIVFNNPDFVDDLAQLNAYGYGAEFLIQKEVGKYTGFMSYTYSRILHQSPLISENRWHPANFDKPHSLKIHANRQFKKWNVNFLFVLESGRPLTYPYYAGLIYSDRNEERFPMYHRLDFGGNYRRKPEKKKNYSIWNFSIYNVYSNHNAFALYPGQISGEYTTVSIFPMIPSLSWSFRF